MKFNLKSLRRGAAASLVSLGMACAGTQVHGGFGLTSLVTIWETIGAVTTLPIGLGLLIKSNDVGNFFAKDRYGKITSDNVNEYMARADAFSGLAKSLGTLLAMGGTLKLAKAKQSKEINSLIDEQKQNQQKNNESNTVVVLSTPQPAVAQPTSAPNYVVAR